MNINPARTSGDHRLSTEYGRGRLIKRTRSICPDCLQPLEARIYERECRVWMDKHCDDHGEFSALLSSDSRHYYESDRQDQSGASCCGSSCGAGMAPAEAAWTNHSCTVLIEITERCNLSCPTCFAGSSPQHSSMMDVDEFTRQVEQLVGGGKGSADMIQLSGGEPTIHPEFFTLIDILADRGFRHVTINSNGIKLAQPAFVQRLADCMKGRDMEIFVYLQFDGFEDSTQSELRGRPDLLKVKEKALDNYRRYGINVHPVMTLTRGINDHEVGAFLGLAVDRPDIKNVVIQPAMYSGRYDNPRRIDRLTLADTVNLICEQFGVFQAEDFTPIPCSDPNCFGMAVALRAGQELLPLSRYFPPFERWGEEGMRQLIDRISDTIDGPRALSEAIEWAASTEVFEELADHEVDRMLDLLIGLNDGKGGYAAENVWDALFVISIKPFMDAWTYDQDRIDACCVHILDESGEPVSFCEFNAINRPRRIAGQTNAIRLVTT
jgi:uncharacterized radical SAM superfamily Fe-S cluster-containing enzyme